VVVDPGRYSHLLAPPPLTRTGADWRIRFLSEKVVCRASPSLFYFGGFRAKDFSTATPDFVNELASDPWNNRICRRRV
jgi:hypothetical protein